MDRKIAVAILNHRFGAFHFLPRESSLLYRNILSTKALNTLNLQSFEVFLWQSTGAHLLNALWARVFSVFYIVLLAAYKFTVFPRIIRVFGNVIVFGF